MYVCVCVCVCARVCVCECVYVILINVYELVYFADGPYAKYQRIFITDNN